MSSQLYTRVLTRSYLWIRCRSHLASSSPMLLSARRDSSLHPPRLHSSHRRIWGIPSQDKDTGTVCWVAYALTNPPHLHPCLRLCQYLWLHLRRLPYPYPSTNPCPSSCPSLASWSRSNFLSFTGTAERARVSVFIRMPTDMERGLSIVVALDPNHSLSSTATPPLS